MAMISKLPKHWPNVSFAQQKEGLKFITKQININNFEKSLDFLIKHKYLTKSNKKTLLKRFRKISNTSYID